MATHRHLTDTQRQDITIEVKGFLDLKQISQHEMAKRAGVPQTFIWAVLNGRFVKMTPRLNRLMQYIRIKNGTISSNEDIMASIDRYLAAGGEISILKSSIEMMTAAYRREPLGQASRT